MRYLIFIALLFISDGKYDNVNLFDYLSKPVKHPEVQLFLEGWGSEEDSFGTNYFNYPDGINARVYEGDKTISQISICNDFDQFIRYTGKIPYNISFDEGVEELIARLGDPTRKAHYKDTLIAWSQLYWDHRGVSISFNYELMEQGITEIECIMVTIPE